jgi:hypothetical protein
VEPSVAECRHGCAKWRAKLIIIMRRHGCAMVAPWLRHGGAMGVSWWRHGWRHGWHHGRVMGASWVRHGCVMGASWARHGVAECRRVSPRGRRVSPSVAECRRVAPSVAEWRHGRTMVAHGWRRHGAPPYRARSVFL